SLRIPAVGAPFWQLAAVNVPLAKVGQVPVVAVNKSVYGLSPTTTEAAKVAAVSKLGTPCLDAPCCPVLSVSRHHWTCFAAKRGSASMASIIPSYVVFCCAAGAWAILLISAKEGNWPRSFMLAVRKASP